MQTYCVGCKKHTESESSKYEIMKNKVIRDQSRCADCMVDKSRFLKPKHNKKSVWDDISQKSLIC